MEGAGGIGAVLTRAITLGAIAVAVGAVIFRLLVLSRARLREPEQTRVAEGIAMGGVVACVAIASVSLVRLYLQASAFVGDGEPISPMVSHVLATQWGRAWMIQTGCAVGGAVTFWLAFRQPGRWWLATTLIVTALALTPSLGGHAMADERRKLISLGADWLHVAGAGGWVGGLVLMTAFMIVLRHALAGREASQALVAAFHRVALGSAALLFLSGFVTLLLRVDSVSSLFNSRYGRIFLVKMLFVAIFAGLGAYHSRTAIQQAAGDGNWALVKTLLLECGAAAFAIGATAVLSGSAPPRE